MNIIFHFPIPFDRESLSASGVRPVHIFDAFVKSGYNVDLISGYLKERKKCIRDIKAKIKKGVKYAFCYSESSTMPTTLTERNHLPHFGTPDYSFFDFCKKKNIPVRLFYRDVYWKFPSYYKQTGFKGRIAYFFYKYELMRYRKSIETLYIPSMHMLKYLPEIKEMNIKELPSGAILYDYHKKDSEENQSSNIIQLFYVGGFSGHYDMHYLTNIVSKNKNIKLFLCVRTDDWEESGGDYTMGDNITLLHIGGEELNKYYEKSDIATIFVKPIEYRKFAIPYKLFEYTGHGLPIISSDNTAMGEYVTKYDIGWSIPYTEEALETLLKHLQENPKEIKQKAINARKFAEKNTWEARCKEIEQGIGIETSI